MIILTYCTLRLLYVNFTIAACSTPCGFQAGHSRVQVSTRYRTAILYLSNDCLLAAEVGRLLRSADMHGHVSYRGPGPSLVTGALLWLDRGSWTRTLAAP